MSVCRSHQRHTQAQPVTSSRRNSPTVQIEKTKYKRAEESQQQPQNTPNREEGLSEITRKHLAQIISSMIPANHSIINEGTTTTEKGDITKEPQDNKEAEKQVVVNNFYIPNGEGGWKRLETGEILPVSPVIPEEKAGVNYKTTSNSGNNSTGETREDPRISYKQDTKFQDLMAPPQMYNFNNPPPNPPTSNNETTTMLECMRQLQLRCNSM